MKRRRTTEIQKKKKVFMLEEGWRPNIRIRLFCVILPVWIIYSILQTIAGGVEVAVDYGAGGLLVFILELVIAIVVIEKMPLINKIIKYTISFIIDYVFDLGPSRNRNMLKNLIAEMNNDDAINEIVMVTGSGHTRALAKLLKTKYGFVQTGSFEPSGVYN